MPSLTLYRKDGACSIAAHMLLRELSLPFTDKPLISNPNNHNLYEGAPGTNLARSAWLAINPTGYVPALTVDDTTITELTAVLFYIASLAPERGLFGSTPLETAQVLSWISWLSTTLNEYGFAGYWRPSRMLGFEAPKEAEEAVKAEGRRTILQGFASIEAKLAGPHAVGGKLTVVDFMLHTFWRWGVEGEFEMMGKYPRFQALVRGVETLQSVRVTLIKERVPLQFP